ncbi:MAG: hypothetical protein OEY66_07480 [Gammaproteobacteria bacterium]|nr:hypothetical protein [Gammaproteobacteria bacterium]
MSDRFYLLLLGLCILMALYIESNAMIYVLVVVVIIEGVTGFTLPVITQKISKSKLEPGLLQYTKPPRFQFGAFRMLRLVLGSVVFTSYIAVHEYNIDMLWFFPWFIGFAVLGAGVSGVCPVYLAIRWLGFK